MFTVRVEEFLNTLKYIINIINNTSLSPKRIRNKYNLTN